MNPNFSRKILWLALVAALSPAQAENLLDVYRLAQQSDPTLAQAQAGFQANVERGIQGKGKVLPNIFFAASHFQVNLDANPSPPPNPRDYSNDSYILQLTQPLYRKTEFASYTQGKAIIAQAEMDFAIAQGDLMLRAVQAYFDVLAAEDALTLARTEKAAIKGQLDLAQRNFSVGNATVVDVHDARARYDVAASQEVSAEADLQVKREALAVLINKNPETLARLAPNLELTPPDPADMEAWNRMAQEHSPLILSQERAVTVAEGDIEKERGGYYPTLDLVASHGYNKTGVLSTPTIFEYTTDQVGVQLTVPLYSGGIAQSKTRESEAKRDRARASVELTRRTTTRQIREAYLAVTSGMARVQALEQARVSSKKALESTLIAYESGARTGTDVLNAQQNLYRTERDLSQARYTYLLSHLKLKLVAGTLTEKDLVAVNERLTNP